MKQLSKAMNALRLARLFFADCVTVWKRGRDESSKRHYKRLARRALRRLGRQIGEDDA